MKTIVYSLNVESINEKKHKELIDRLPWQNRIDKINRQKNYSAKKLAMGAGILLHYVLEKAGVKDFEIEENKHGKPYLVNEKISYNLSHSKDYVICAINEGTESIGADIEYTRKCNTRIMERYFSENEIQWADSMFGELKNPDEAYTRLWTLKESYVKMTGRGIDNSFAQIDLSGVDIYFKTYRIGEYIVSICKKYENIIENKSLTLDKICFYRYK